MIEAVKIESKLSVPQVINSMGLITGFIHSSIKEHDDISHIWDYYVFGNPEKIKHTKFTLYQDHLSYPGDADLAPIAKLTHKKSNTQVLFYPYAYVVIIDNKGETTVGRMD
jgi:hypothetical protein